jgi:hypothetical protein
MSRQSPAVSMTLSPYDDDSVAPRRLLLLELGAWLVVLASRSAVRERVPWPNPRLAMLDTCRRMSSIEVVKLVSRGFGRPSTSHRIFGFRVARARFFLVLSARHPVDRFIHAPYRTWRLQRGKTLDGDEGGRMEIPHSIHLPARRLSAESDGMYEQSLQ